MQENKTPRPETVRTPLKVGKLTLAMSTIGPGDCVSVVMEMKRHLPTPLGKVVSDPFFRELPEKVQIAVAEKAAFAQLHRNEPEPFELIAQLLHPDCLAFALWLMARKDQPGLTVKEVRDELEGMSLSELQVLAGEASGLLPLGRDESEPTGESSSSSGPTGAATTSGST